MPGSDSLPPKKTILIGRTISRLVAHAPWIWPLVSGPVMRFFDAAAGSWDAGTKAGSPEHLAAIAAGVLEVDDQPERILDVGCGTGAGTLFLAREYPRARVRGIDLSPRMIHVANAKIGLDPEARVAFKVGDAADLPYPDEQFDLVTQTNLPVFFAEINRVLRPGGHVIIASSLGQKTPFSTPDATVRKKFGRLGVTRLASGNAPGPDIRGTYFVGRKSVSAK